MGDKWKDQDERSGRGFNASERVHSQSPESVEPDIKSIHFDALSFAGIGAGETSYPSVALHKINIPEIRNLKTEFIYNHFVFFS